MSACFAGFRGRQPASDVLVEADQEGDAFGVDGIDFFLPPLDWYAAPKAVSSFSWAMTRVRAWAGGRKGRLVMSWRISREYLLGLG